MKTIKRIIETVSLLAILLVVLTGCYTGEKGPLLDEKLLESTIDEMIKELEHKYVIPETAKKVIAELNSEKSSLLKRNGAEEFEWAVDRILRSYDKHMHIDYAPGYIHYLDSIKNYPENKEEKEEKRALAEKKNNFGFEKVEKLKKDIGYIKISEFCGTKEAFKKLASVMNSLAKSKSIIIDLTESRGGYPEMVQYICSYFFADSIHLNSIYCRYTNTTDEYWTIDVSEEKFVNTKLYILTGEFTFSAAEELAYNMQQLNRAKIIGETTYGGAHPVEEYVLNGSFVLAIPDSKSINPISKTNWEKIGVKPDIKTNSESALEKALELIEENNDEK